MLELFCSTPAGITGEVTHASFILARNRQGMFATNASFHFIKQLGSILFYFSFPWKHAFILLPISSEFRLHDSSSINSKTKEKQKNNHIFLDKRTIICMRMLNQNHVNYSAFWTWRKCQGLLTWWEDILICNLTTMWKWLNKSNKYTTHTKREGKRWG